MKTNKIKTFCGSISKKESLVPIQQHIVENTWVAEASFPYANYYGQAPTTPKPNSLFLFTDQFYSLEEVLRFGNALKKCFTEEINIASATIKIQNKQFAAIRIKNFPNYEKLIVLQKCFIHQGIHFISRLPLVTEINAVINKCFKLEELEEDIYLDRQEEHKGYITSKNKISRKHFEDLIVKIQNNSDCSLYDAVPGGFIINSCSVDFLRVYSENLNIELLKCIKKQLNRFIS